MVYFATNRELYSDTKEKRQADLYVRTLKGLIPMILLM